MCQVRSSAKVNAFCKPAITHVLQIYQHLCGEVSDLVLSMLVQTEFQEVSEGAQVEGDNDLSLRIIGQYTPSHFRFEVHGAFLCDSGIIGEGAREHCIAPSLVLFFCKSTLYFRYNDLELVVVSAISLALLAVSYSDT